MALLPAGRSYNEFSDEDKTKIEQLALKSAEANKKYIDKEMGPFLRGRVLVLYGTAGQYDKSKGVLEVAVAGEGGENMVLSAVGINDKRAKKLRGKAVRVLQDTRSSTVYFDDQAF